VDAWINEFSVTPPAAPGNNATVTLFDTTTMFGETWSKVISALNMSRVSVSFLSLDQASAANGLVPAASSNGGTNWDQTQAGITIAASVAGTVNTYDFDIDIYDDFRLRYTAGGTGPTVWRITIKVLCGQRTVAT
jgi:hypothetical protein